MNIATVNDKKYTLILEDILQDNRLSFEAKGFYCFMESLPEDILIEDVAKHGNVSISTIKGYIDELVKAGYWVINEDEDNLYVGSEG